MLKIMTLIPARKGSKRLRNKNRKMLGGKPLVKWTIEFAQSAGYLDNILISSDDSNIIKIGRDMGCLVPWVRPDHLCGDNASSVDVALHALDWFESAISPVDGLLLLQPTSPFRKQHVLRDLIDMFENDPSVPAVSVSPVLDNPKGLFRLKNGAGKPYFSIEDSGVLYPSPFLVNGSMYLCAPDYLRKNRDFLGSKINPIVTLSKAEGLDIDVRKDFEQASVFLEEFACDSNI